MEMHPCRTKSCKAAEKATTTAPSLLFHIDKSSLGVSHIGVATPWDDFPYAKSNANTFVRARAYRVFLTSCVGNLGIDLGDIPPHSVRKPYTNLPPSSIVTLMEVNSEPPHCSKSRIKHDDPSTEERLRSFHFGIRSN